MTDPVPAVPDLAIDIWYGNHQCFGYSGLSQRWINVLGRASSPAGVSSVRWGVDGWPGIPLTLGPTAFRLRSPGDFNIEIDAAKLAPGPHALRIVANDAAGREVERVVTVDMAPQVGRLPLPRFLRWSDATSINQAAQVVDGLWKLTPQGVRVVEPHYDRIIAIGDRGWTDFVVTVPITIHRWDDTPASFNWPSYGQAVGVLARWQGHWDWEGLYPRRGWNPLGALLFYGWRRERDARRLFMFGGRGGILWEEQDARALELERPYMFKLLVQSQGFSASLYRGKLWPADEAEPEPWDAQVAGQVGELPAGSVLLVAHHCEATFGNVTVAPLPADALRE